MSAEAAEALDSPVKGYICCGLLWVGAQGSVFGVYRELVSVPGPCFGCMASFIRYSPTERYAWSRLTIIFGCAVWIPEIMLMTENIKKRIRMFLPAR